MEIASDSLDRRLSWTQRLWLACHLAMCGACRACTRQMRAIDSIARKIMLEKDLPAPPEQPVWLSESARQRINQLLQQSHHP